MSNNISNNEEPPVFEIKKWNAVALWAWGKYLYLIVDFL